MKSQASILVYKWSIRVLLDLEVALMRLEEVLLGLNGALLHSFQQSGWVMAPLAPGSYFPDFLLLPGKLQPHDLCKQ